MVTPCSNCNSSLKLPESGKYNSQGVIGTTIFNSAWSVNPAHHCSRSRGAFDFLCKRRRNQQYKNHNRNPF